MPGAPRTMPQEPRTVTIAHSPDTDDAFMFAGLVLGKVGSHNFRYTHILREIQILNEWAREGRYEITALSVHAYAYVADTYAILTSGASMGEADYGPMVVARQPIDPVTLPRKRIAVPGTMTTAYLYLQLALRELTGRDQLIPTITLPFEEVLPAVRNGDVDAGVLIHEVQMTYQDDGLVNILPLYAWWHRKTGLPMPLGVNVIKKDMDPVLRAQMASDLRASIEFALAHRREAIEDARRFARDLPYDLLDTYVGRYVNRRTVHMGEEERRATALILRMAAEAHLIPTMPTIAWV